VPGGLLRAVDRGQRRALPAGDRDRAATDLVAQPAGGAAVRRLVLSVVSVVVAVVLFVVPFAFIVLQALKDRTGASALDFSWPDQLRFVENLVAVVEARV